eukprot:TRINITY_DN17151_c0_g1_i3.p1 TRINITY_DN17151_c0_g1~~TRINITY_DN17151_c0_g1_i3.p1  ORF type:complete len:497 (+),score=149.92 TRINITY_DN17151_c0_g1_i3:23-1492(+)
MALYLLSSQHRAASARLALAECVGRVDVAWDEACCSAELQAHAQRTSVATAEADARCRLSAVATAADACCRVAGEERKDRAALQRARDVEFATAVLGPARRSLTVLTHPDPACLAGGFEVRRDPLRGRGVFARRAFEPGEVLWAERPFISVPDLSHVEAWLGGASAAARTEASVLAQTGELTADVLKRLMKSHAFLHRGHKVLFPAACLMNHSCSPNVIYQSYQDQACLRAAARIEAGAEVLHSYARREHGWSTADRRAALLAEKGFSCSCSLCTSPDRTRSRRCPTCPAHADHAGDSEWVCSRCGRVAMDAEEESGVAAAVRRVQAAPQTAAAAALLLAAVQRLGPRHWTAASAALSAAGCLSQQPGADPAAVAALLRYYFAWRDHTGFGVWHAWTLKAAATGTLAVARTDTAAAAALAARFEAIHRMSFGAGCPASMQLAALLQRHPSRSQQPGVDAACAEAVAAAAALPEVRQAAASEAPLEASAS